MESQKVVIHLSGSDQCPSGMPAVGIVAMQKVLVHVIVPSTNSKIATFPFGMLAVRDMSLQNIQPPLDPTKIAMVLISRDK